MAAIIPIAAQAVALYAVKALAVEGALSLLVMGGATLLGAYVSQQLSGRDSSRQESDELAIRSNTVSPNKIIPIIYGERLVGSNDVFVEIGRDGQTSSKIKYLWVVHCLGEGECEGISTDDEGNPLIYIDSKPINDFDTNLVSFWYYSGTNDQGYNSYLFNGTKLDEPASSESKVDDRLRNTSYIVFRFKYEKSPFLGVPQREIVLKGIKLYDFRDMSTSWSDNPVLVLYDYLTNKRYGLGWEDTHIDLPSWSEAATYCDTAGWKINYVIASSIKAQTVIDTILGHFRGALYWYNNLLFLRYSDLRSDFGEAPVFNVTDEHIARDDEGRAMVMANQPSRFNIPDGAIVNFISKENNWVTDKINLGETTGNIQRIDFAGFTDRKLALEMGLYVLERQRLNRVFSFTLRPDTVALDTNDLITITSQELGISQQLARVRTNVILENGLIQTTVILESETLYDIEYQPDLRELYSVDFASPLDAPPSVENVVLTEHTYYYRERSFVRLNITFDPPGAYPWFSHVDVYVAYQRPDGSAPLDDEYVILFSASDDFQVDPVEEGKAYYLRLNSVSTFNVKQPNYDAVKLVHLVKGVTEIVPTCPSFLYAAVNIRSIDLSSNELADPDIAGYEFRMGIDWLQAILIAVRSHPTLSFSDVKPGSYQFWLNSIHTNGNYCPSPKSAAAVFIDEPPGTTQFFQYIIPYSTSVSGNVTATGTYPNQNLSCTHISGNLEGEFISDEIDIGSTEQYMLVYVLFDFWVVSGPITWTGLASPPNDWWTFAYDNDIMKWKTWYQVLGDIRKLSAAELEISLDYSNTPGGPYTTVNRLELLTVIVEGRYARVRYKITDINNDSFLTLGPSIIKAAYIDGI